MSKKRKLIICISKYIIPIILYNSSNIYVDWMMQLVVIISTQSYLMPNPASEIYDLGQSVSGSRIPDRKKYYANTYDAICHSFASYQRHPPQ